MAGLDRVAPIALALARRRLAAEIARRAAATPARVTDAEPQDPHPSP